MNTTAMQASRPRRSSTAMPNEFLFSLISLALATILIQAIYALHVRPVAQAIMERDRAAIANDPTYVSERSFYIVVKDYEQEAEIILMIWALAILWYRSREQNQERRLL